MDDITLRRLRIVPVPRGDGLSRAQALATLTELAGLGYRLTNPERLAQASPSVLAELNAHMQVLAKMRGADRTWVPLFSGFPDKVPDGDAYLASRITGFMGALFGMFSKQDGEQLENGVIVPDWLFNLEQFGADPITQMQTGKLFAQGAAQQAARAEDEHVEWIDLSLAFREEATARTVQWAQQTLYANAPLNAGAQADLIRMLTALGPDIVEPERIPLKETLAFLLAVYWKANDARALTQVTRSPTDLLRLFAMLTETDVSLAAPIRYPAFSRGQRRMTLTALESCGSLAEDLWRNHRLWLAIGKGLHVGEYAERFPKSFQAFSAIRQGSLTSYASRTEALIRDGNVPGLIDHLSHRPGVFTRKIHELLYRFPDQTALILERFSMVADRVPVKTLLVLDAHFQTINERAERTIVNKKGALKVLPNKHQGRLTDAQLSAVRTVLEEALLTQLGEREDWTGKTVFIAPELADVTVPLQQRTASDGLIPLGRGSRIPVDMDRVLRLFVYWKQSHKRTDLDLSVIQFNAEMEYIGHVSYTQLSEEGIVHSGDIQSAPRGASEFIDITLSALPAGVRYLSPQIYRYCGERFSELADSFAGWMIRQNVDANTKSFDPKTVANGYALNGEGAYAIPFVVDVEAGEIVLVDLTVRGMDLHNRVEGASNNVAQIARQIIDFTRTRPTMARLAELHAQARGATRLEADADAETADIRFAVRGGTYNAEDVSMVLSELL